MFIITHDYISDDTVKPVSICGPRHISDEQVGRLKGIAAGKGREGAEHFYMYDDDGERYYAGYYVDAHGSDELEPLDCFGGPNAGCTTIKMKNHEGKYTVV